MAFPENMCLAKQNIFVPAIPCLTSQNINNPTTCQSRGSGCHTTPRFKNIRLNIEHDYMSYTIHLLNHGCFGIKWSYVQLIHWHGRKTRLKLERLDSSSTLWIHHGSAIPSHWYGDAFFYSGRDPSVLKMGTWSLQSTRSHTWPYMAHQTNMLFMCPSAINKMFFMENRPGPLVAESCCFCNQPTWDRWFRSAHETTSKIEGSVHCVLRGAFDIFDTKRFFRWSPGDPPKLTKRLYDPCSADDAPHTVWRFYSSWQTLPSMGLEIMPVQVNRPYMDGLGYKHFTSKTWVLMNFVWRTNTLR